MDVGRGTILLVEADAARQASARAALQHGGFAVVAAQHSDHALTLLKDISFDVLVAAIELPGAVDYLHLPMAPAELVARVDEAARRWSGARAMAEAKQQAAQLALTAGALEEALARTLPISSTRLRTVPQLAEAPSGADAEQLSRLSPREREIANLLMQGNSVTTMATSLALSPNTIRNHVKSIFGKLGVHSQVALLSRLSGNSR